MGRIFKNIRSLVQPAVFFIPITYYFFLFVIALVLANAWLSSRELIPGSSFTDIFKLLVKTGSWFLTAFICFALLSVFVSYCIFRWKKKDNKVSLVVKNTALSLNAQDYPTQRIHISISPLLKPLMGFIKLRLQYDSEQYSNKFILAETKQHKIFSTNYSGDYQWNLPEIKEYHVEKLIIYFEDLFQFFSLAVALPVRDRFHTHPFAPPVVDFSISPRKTENTESRIEELKKVEGEYLNYKNFEDNDDVRRIVWKIYAKNKDLVVRIPEILDPYASHAYMYVSFFNGFDTIGNNMVEIFFLNYYKSMVWAIYQNLGKKGFALKYIADQQTPSKYFPEEQQSIQYTITTSKWQDDKNVKTFANSKDASLIVISSLCDSDDVGSLLDNRIGNTMFVLIKLSKSLHRSYFIHWLQWLFIQQEKKDLEIYKANWRLSLLRPKILQNEKKLEAVFNKHAKTLII